MFATLRIALIVLVIILGGAAAWWRVSRHVDRSQPENPGPHVEQWQDSMRELDEAAQKSQEARDKSDRAVQPQRD